MGVASCSGNCLVGLVAKGGLGVVFTQQRPDQESRWQRAQGGQTPSPLQTSGAGAAGNSKDKLQGQM